MNISQPKDDDAVLGGDRSPPVGGVVLGGIAGTRRRFTSSLKEDRVAAIKEALKYGDDGWAIATQGLQDKSSDVVWAAYQTLRSAKSARADFDLCRYSPYKKFQLLNVLHDYQGIGEIRGLAIASNNQTLVSAVRSGLITRWDLNSGEIVETIQAPDLISTVVMSGDCKLFVAGLWKNGVLVLDLKKFQRKFTKILDDYIFNNAKIVVSSDGKMLVASQPRFTEQGVMPINAYNISADGGNPWGYVRYPLLSGHKNSVYGIAISSRAKLLVSCDWGETIKVWNLSSGACIKSFYQPMESANTIAISPNGKRIVTGGRERNTTVRRLKLNTSVGGFPESGITMGMHNDIVNAIAITPDSRTIVSASQDATLKIWDMEEGTLHATLSGHSRGVLKVAISPDGKTIVSGDQDGTLRVWGLPSQLN